MILFRVTPYFVVAVQPCMELIPIKKNFSMTNEITSFKLETLKKRTSFSLKQITQVQWFSTQDKGTWWQDLNGLLQVLSVILKRFSSSNQYYLIMIFIFYIVLLGSYVSAFFRLHQICTSQNFFVYYCHIFGIFDSNSNKRPKGFPLTP